MFGRKKLSVWLMRIGFRGFRLAVLLGELPQSERQPAADQGQSQETENRRCE
jgi:hypothetical protein